MVVFQFEGIYIVNDQGFAELLELIETKHFDMVHFHASRTSIAYGVYQIQS